MNTEIFDPQQIRMTSDAVSHVERQLEKEGKNALLLRVTESGCNGYMYELEFVNDEPHDSRKFAFGENVEVYVENSHWDLVGGTTIDYVTEGLNSALKFDNPNADTLCGCGESFSVGGT